MLLLKGPSITMIYLTELKQRCPLMSEAERDYLSLNQPFYYFFILPFLAQPLKNASVMTQMGAIAPLGPSAGGRRAASSTLTRSGERRTPRPGLVLPLSRNTSTHELEQQAFTWECRWHGTEYRCHLFQKNEVLVPMSISPLNF